MSSNSVPVSEAGSPFVQSTTPTIERANRLLSLRAHPGFLDLLRLSQELVQEAADTCADFGGWDPHQIIVLKVRMQAAKEMHQALLVRLQNAIQDGLDEAKARISTMPEKTPAEILEQGDYVRQRVLQNFEEQDNRTAGSY
jgi:hypothetical protein